MLSRAHEPEAASYYADGFWRSGDLWTDFAAAVDRNPERVAIHVGDRSITYAGLRRAAVALSSRLAAEGVRTGDVVTMLGRHSVEAVISIVACLHRGAVMAPVPPMFSAQQLSALMKQCDARALIAFGGANEISKCAELAAQVRCFLAFEPELADDLAADAAADPAREPVDADAVALLLHSSGTTSSPKGIVHSGNTLRYTVDQIHERWELTPDDTRLVVLEFGFVGGLIFGYFPALLSGATAALLTSWSAADALALLERHRCAYTLLMPTHAADLLEYPDRSRHDTSSLRVLGSPGLTPERRAAMWSAFGVAPLGDYGLSEVPGHTGHALDDTREKILTTQGRPYRGTDIRILGADGSPLPPGQSGEVVVNGPSRFLGFLNNDELTRASLTESGHYRTGDVGLIDEDGHFVYIGRSKDIIRRGGVTIVPAEVEPVLLRHPAVHEAALVGIPDERLGERICAAVILTEQAGSLTLEELTGHLAAEGVAKYTWPERLELFDDFPRTPSLKPVKSGIVDAIGRRDAAQSVSPEAATAPAP